MSQDDQTVDCDQHGRSPMAHVCQHLLAAGDDEAVGFYQSFIDLDEDPDTHAYEAWCQSCDDKLGPVNTN